MLRNRELRERDEIQVSKSIATKNSSNGFDKLVCWDNIDQAVENLGEMKDALKAKIKEVKEGREAKI